MQDEIDKALKGELDEQGIKDLEGKLSDEGKKNLREALAFRDKKKDAEAKAKEAEEAARIAAENLKKIQDDTKTAEEQLNSTRQANTQFRQEQIDKAKKSFFEEMKIPAEEQAKYEDEFKKLDSGKMDPELIKEDLKRAYAAVNAPDLLKAKQDQERAAANAAGDNQNGAGSHSNPPAGSEKKTHSDQAIKLANDAGISPDAAERQLKEGRHRTIAG